MLWRNIVKKKFLMKIVIKDLEKIKLVLITIIIKIMILMKKINKINFELFMVF
jgi:hypothetical protein